MHFHLLPREEALAALRSGPEGLSREEAARRRGEFGPNTVARVRRAPLLGRFIREFIHFFALILWVAAGLCFLAEWRDPGSGMARLGTAILVVILVNGLFAFWQEARAEQAVRGLEHLLPQEVLVLREGRLVREPAADLVPGDVLVLEDGDVVPADVRILEGFGLMVDASVLTGESVALPREAAEETESSPLRARNVLLAGTSLVSGQGRGLVYATGMRTEFGHIAGLTQAVKEGRGTLQLEIARVSRTIAVLALALGGLFFLLGRQLGLTFWQNLVFAVGIIVANVPEGLLPTVTLALAMASQRMARRQALVRNLPTVETLGAATVICTDKTGTLTQNRMEVRRIYAGGRLLEPGAPGVPEALLEGARRCHTLKGEPGAWHGDAMEVALRALGVAALGEPEPWPQVDEIPFDSDRRRLSLLLRGPGGLVLQAKGALQALLPLCSHLECPGGPSPLGETEAQTLRQVESELAAQGLRVLAFAQRRVPEGTPREALETELTFTGLVALEDPPRPEVPAALATCRAAGIRVFMVTGDHPLTALAIARQIGLVTQAEAQAPFRVVTGDDLRRMSDAHLQLLLDAPELVFARLDADQKHRIVVALQRKGEVVAVTGDGVNDAPALKAADIGVAMGRSGTEVAREAADLVLADDNFASIVAAVEEGRAIYANIRRFLTYHMTSNCGELMPYLAFVLFRVPLPLTILQILIIDLGTDMIPALALGAEPPAEDTMRRPPRPRGERLLNLEVLSRAYGVLGLVEGAAGLAAYAVVLRAGGWRWGAPLGPLDPLYLQATTACLSGIIVLQMAAVFLCRHESRSIFRQGLLGNPLILAGVGLEALVLYALHQAPPLRAALGTAPVPLSAWLVLLPFLLLMLALEEARKAWVRRRETL